MKSHQDIHGITSISYHIHVSHTKTICYLKTSQSHANTQPTSQFMIYLTPSTPISVHKIP